MNLLDEMQNGNHCQNYSIVVQTFWKLSLGAHSRTLSNVFVKIKPKQ